MTKADQGATRIQVPGTTITTVLELRALLRTSEPPRVATVGDRRGRMRDAFEDEGWPAISIDELPSESERAGIHFQGSLKLALTVPHTFDIAVTFWPCEQQTISLGLPMAATKAADGRMFWGIAGWIKAFCMPAKCLLAEQPDVYIVDFHDAPHMITDPTEWEGEWRKKTLFFVRGAALPVPLCAKGEGSADWHKRSKGSAEAQAHARDETCIGMARGIAAQLRPDGSGKQPDAEVEIERFAAAWHRAGLPVPPDYNAAGGQPLDAEAQAYARARGPGDGRRVPEGTVPFMLATHAQPTEATSKHSESRQERLLRKLQGVTIPAVSVRGLRLATAVRALRATEAAAAKGAAKGEHGAPVATVDLEALPGPAVVVVPAIDRGCGIEFLFSSTDPSSAIGQVSAVAGGATSAERKAGTAEALALLFPLFGAEPDVVTGTGVRVAPAVYLNMGEHEVTVVAAWVPMALAGAAAIAAAGFVWCRLPQLCSLGRRKLAEVVAWKGGSWSKPQGAPPEGARTGAGAAAPTEGGSQRDAVPIDVEEARARTQRDLHHLSDLLTEAARAEPRLATQLGCWREKVAEGDPVQPPEDILRCAFQPEDAQFLRKPFVRRCEIPETEPMDARWPPPRWPPFVPKPRSAEATYREVYRREMAEKMGELTAWNARAVAGDAGGRPQAGSWSDAARLPWLQGRVLDFRSGRCTLLGAGGPAVESNLSKDALLYMLRDYTHRRFVSYCVHGVRLSDTLPLDTTVAPNLYSLYLVQGGPDAVANEMDNLKGRGWYGSSAGWSAGPLEGHGANRQLTSPRRISPRGSTERKDGPPRGLAEEGWPRQPVWTSDAQTEVDSLNNSSGKRVGQGGPDLDAWPLREGKPRVEDECVNACVLWCLARTLVLSLLVLLFDYKYFFHQLVYEMAELWKMGFAVPARATDGGAHPELLDELLEYVLSMGWTRASLVAQDLGNALVWRLELDVDEASTGYVAKMRAENEAFEEAWAGRLALKHDDYGTQARLISSLQYTDDKTVTAVGPVMMAHVIVCFCRMIGPSLYASDDAAEAARGTARRHASLLRGDAIGRAVATPRRGSVRALGRGQRAAPGEVVLYAGRVSPGGNCFMGEARAATRGFACLLACGPKHVDIADIAALRGLQVHKAQSLETAAHLWQWLRGVQRRLRRESITIALRCGCDGTLHGGWCHVRVLVAHLEQQLDIEDDVERGPPPDPVANTKPGQVVGLNLEAAHTRKWHLGSAAIWIGVGLSVQLLVMWVPQSKAAPILLDILSVFEGTIVVSQYRSLVGKLQDLLTPTGGGWYRTKGLHAPLMDDAEAGEGVNTPVRMRTQMRARLTDWRKKLVDCPGASMLSAIGPAPRAGGGVIWEIRGDAANEEGDRRKREGLGAFWYTIWWNVPLDSIEGLAGLHITCQETIELGLGVVITSPILAGTGAHVRLVSDAIVGYLTLRARRPDGKRAREAHASALVAVHEVIMHRPEWQALHAPPNYVDIVQNYGETLLLDDAASRLQEGVIRDVCSALRLEPRRLDPLPDRALEYLREAVDAATAAMSGGWSEVERQREARADRPDPAVPNIAKRSKATVDYDGSSSALSDLLAVVVSGPARPVHVVSVDTGVHAAGGAFAVAVTIGSARARLAAGGELVSEPSSLQPFVEAAPKVFLAAFAGERQELESRAQAAATRSLAAALRQKAVRSVSVVPGESAPVRRVMARAVAPAAGETIRDSARAAVLGHQTASTTLLALRADKVESDGLDEVRGLLIERSIRSARSNEDGLGLTGGSDELLQGLLSAAHRAFERRFAKGTRKLDKSYWKFWKQVCDRLGTPPLRTNEMANSGAVDHLFRREVALSLCAFLIWVTENPQFKITSMFARLRGVARRHKAMGISFVSLALVAMAAEGLVQEHIDVHGTESLLPKSKEPLTFGEIKGMLTLKIGTVVGGKHGVPAITVGDNVHWQGVVVFINLYCTMGPRKEAIALGVDEVFSFGRKLSLWHLTYRIRGQLLRAPSREQLLAFGWGDGVYISTCACKNDPKNVKYGNTPTLSEWHPTRTISFAREMVKYELMRSALPERRKLEPMVLGPCGTSWTKAGLDSLFKMLIGYVAAPARAKQLSVHSFRVWLACALLAAGATPEQIMLLLRWSSEAARQLYARLSERVQGSLLNAACDVQIDSIRSHTMLLATAAVATAASSPPAAASAPTTADAATGEEGPDKGAQSQGEAVALSALLLEAAHEYGGALPPATDLPPLDDDDEHARLHEAADELRTRGEAADRAMKGPDDDDTSDEGSDCDK